jgi:predicted nuclease of predicted toxin-antitoxin system
LKISLDHNLDHRLKRYLTDHDIATTQDRGWSDVLNGELIDLTESNGFDVLLTADSNIKTQQKIDQRRISILVIRAFNNRLRTHLEMLHQISQALSETRAGQILEVFHNDMNVE